MTVLEKLNYDKAAIVEQYEAWTKGPGCHYVDRRGSPTAYDSLYDRYQEKNYKTFLDWALSEYKEFGIGDICTDGTIVLDVKPNDCMQIVGFNIFETGWAYCLNRLKENGLDVSKPFALCKREFFRQALDNSWTYEKDNTLLKRIDDILAEHDPTNDQCIVYYGLTQEDKKFYFEYDKFLRTVKAALRNGIHHLDSEYALNLTIKTQTN